MSDTREVSRTDFTCLLVDSGRLLWDRPALALPFLIAAAAAAVGDLLRLTDSVPTIAQTSAQRGLTHLVLHATPSVTSAVGTRPAALLGLKSGPLLGVILTEGFPSVLTAIATVLTIVWVIPSRAASTPTRGKLLFRALRLLGYELAVLTVFFVLGMTAGSLGLLTLVLIIGLLVATVRLFVVPASIARGRGLREAISTSLALTRGHGWTLFGLIVVLGVTANVLVSVPVLVGGLGASELPLPIGTAVATGCVGTLHALLVGLAANRFV